MVTATVWYILIDAYLKGELSLTSRHSARIEVDDSKEHKLATLSWSIYSLVLVAVSVSRVYLACHFPHQCLCGAILGLLVARFVSERLPSEQLSRRKLVLGSCFMLVSAMTTYAGLQKLGVDPLWSVEKAMRWCVKKEYIHLDTTPFFSMMRYLGFALGSGLAFKTASQLASSSTKESRNGNLLARRLLTALLSIGFGQLLFAVPVPKDNLKLFYVISLTMYTIFSYSIAQVVPAITKRALK